VALYYLTNPSTIEVFSIQHLPRGYLLYELLQNKLRAVNPVRKPVAISGVATMASLNVMLFF
jgi:hypothetical protein